MEAWVNHGKRNTVENTRLHAFFLAFWLLSIAVFWAPLRQWLALSWNDQEYTHLLVIPCIAGALVWWTRNKVFRAAAPEVRIGAPLALLTGAAGWLLFRLLGSGQTDYVLSIAILSVVLTWAAGFLLCYGAGALRSARFPLSLLILTVPIPAVLMGRLVVVLQTWSSDLVYLLFSLTGTPFFRQGFTFELPGIGIEVAKECSSIHSFWALFITALLVGHFALRSLPAKVCLSLFVTPIAVFTNAVRIVMIWFLATHVDIGFMYGNLHRNGGILFSLISLSLLLSLLWILRKLEARRQTRSASMEGRGVSDPSGDGALALK
jgi:exosortase